MANTRESFKKSWSPQHSGQQMLSIFNWSIPEAKLEFLKEQEERFHTLAYSRAAGKSSVAKNSELSIAFENRKRNNIRDHNYHTQFQGKDATSAGSPVRWTTPSTIDSNRNRRNLSFGVVEAMGCGLNQESSSSPQNDGYQSNQPIHKGKGMLGHRNVSTILNCTQGIDFPDYEMKMMGRKGRSSDRNPYSSWAIQEALNEKLVAPTSIPISEDSRKYIKGSNPSCLPYSNPCRYGVDVLNYPMPPARLRKEDKTIKSNLNHLLIPYESRDMYSRSKRCSEQLKGSLDVSLLPLQRDLSQQKTSNDYSKFTKLKQSRLQASLVPMFDECSGRRSISQPKKASQLQANYVPAMDEMKKGRKAVPQRRSTLEMSTLNPPLTPRNSHLRADSRRRVNPQKFSSQVQLRDDL